MDIALYIGKNGSEADYSGYVRPGSVRLEDLIGGKSVLSFDLIGDYTEISAEVGDLVYLVYGERLFGGIVDEIEKRELVYGSNTVEYHFECVDWHDICDRRVVKVTYEDMTVQQIIDDLIANYLGTEGIWTSFPSSSDDQYYTMLSAAQPASIPRTDGIDSSIASTVIGKINAVYDPIRKVLDDIAEEVGATWWISPYKQLHVAPRDKVTAPFSIDDNSKITNVSVTKSRRWYRNRQYVITKAKTTSRTETFVGDGSRRTFSLEYPIADEKPTVTVDGVTRRIQERGKTDTTVLGTAYGAGFANQPNGDSVTLVSDDATDTMYVRVIGVYADGGSDYEDIQLQGTTPVTTSITTWDKIAAVVVDPNGTGSHNGTITVSNTTSGGTITTIGIDDSDSGVVDTALTSIYVKPQAYSDDATTTAPLVLEATSFSGGGFYLSSNLNGTNTVTFSQEVQKVKEMCVGAIPTNVKVTLFAVYEWTYSQGQNEISQSELGKVLSGYNTLSVTYRGQYPIAVMASDTTTEIPARATAEGGSGYYDNVLRVSGPMEEADANSLAAALIDRYAPFQTTVEFDTYTSGLRAGQLLTITLNRLGITGSYLITSVEFRDMRVSSRVGAYLWRVKCVSGEAIGDWGKFFRDLFDRGLDEYRNIYGIVEV